MVHPDHLEGDWHGGVATTGCEEHVQRGGERSAGRRAPASYAAGVVLATEEYERLCRLEKSGAPTLGELLLEIPQDDVEFERLSLGTCAPSSRRGFLR